jgi:hypothetical protein
MLKAAGRTVLALLAAARRAALAMLAALAATCRAAVAKLATARRTALAMLAAARGAALAMLAALAAARRAALAKLAAARRAVLAMLAAARHAALAKLAAARRAVLAMLAAARHAALAKLAAARRAVLAMLAAARHAALAKLAAARRAVLAMLAAARHAVLAMLAAGRRAALAKLAATRRSDHYSAARRATGPMSASEFAAVLRRRWYVLALAGLFTLVGILAVRVRPVSYQGCGELYFAASDPGVNVYLQYDPALAPVTGMVTQTMMSQPMQQQMQARGVTDYAVTQTNTGEIRFPQYDLPTMQVCATSRTPQGTVFAAQLVTADLRSVLHQMQTAQNVPANSFITALQVTPAVPVPITGRPSLAYLGVLLIGAVAAVPLVLWSDPLLSYLECRRSAAWRGYP